MIIIIMYQQFINRKDELNFLDKEYKGRDSSLVVIYGRRRVGKTALVRKFISNKPYIYFLADSRGDYQNLKELQKFMADYLKEDIFNKAKIYDWIELFKEFSNRMKGKPVIVIDEFPMLIALNSAIPSIFQKIWDNILSQKQVQLILLGSSIGMMETEVLGYKSPLYGRRTGQLKVLPLKFGCLSQFFPNYSLEDLVKMYSVTDGIPAYIKAMKPDLDFYENLKEVVFTPGGFLYQEAEILLRQELREPSNYFNILKAIAMGRTKFGEIVNATELDKTVISKYINTLLLLHVIRKDFPITQNKETRNARYVFEDNYFNFWFRFVYPNKTLLEGGKVMDVINSAKAEMNIHFSRSFESICKEFLFIKAPVVFNKIGRWWYKDKEIDIVALNERTKDILFAECKWKDKVNAKKVLQDLQQKAESLDWNKGKRKESYAIFAKSFRKKIEEPNLSLFDLEKMQRVFKKASG